MPSFPGQKKILMGLARGLSSHSRAVHVWGERHSNVKHMSGQKQKDMACVTAVTVHGPQPDCNQQWLWEWRYEITQV